MDTGDVEPSESRERGLAARERCPLESHAEWSPGPGRAHPADQLAQEATDRLPELLALRTERLSVSAFTFFRGSAVVMAADLARTPTTGLTTQLCGDAHLGNFGLFGTPERRLVFDINDFDETDPGPWEWDVKRLAASLLVAAHDNDFDDDQSRDVVRAGLQRYRRAMLGFAGQSTLAVWYAHADADELQATTRISKKADQRVGKALRRARARDSTQALDRLTDVVDGVRRFRSDPPVLVPARELLPEVERADLEAQLNELLDGYRATLLPDRQFLLDQFRFVDLARRVGGVGSVGTRCWVVLLVGKLTGDPLFLQVKEARASVLEPYVQPDLWEHHGERVVTGQRLMQAASDIFLGWESVPDGSGGRRDYYVRQLRDWKLSARLDRFGPEDLSAYAALCGWTLARAHARSGDRVALAAYLGEDDTFERAFTRFANTYAEQAQRDHTAYLGAVG